MHQFANKISIKTIYHSMRHVATDSHIRIVIIIHVLVSWDRPSERFQVDWDDINKDGYQDFAIGAPYENDYKGNYARERQKIFRITTLNITLDNDNYLIKPVTNKDIWILRMSQFGSLLNLFSNQFNYSTHAFLQQIYYQLYD